MSNWQDVNRLILDGLDLEAEYRAIGLEIHGKPSSNGWTSCKVFKSDERSPSAGVNLTGDHPHRGRYKSFTGECENLSFFEFCARAGRFDDWKDARDFYRKQLGIKAPTARKKPPSEKLKFRDYNENLVRSWTTHKPPIKSWAVRIAGGQITGYPAKGEKYTCIAIPVFGPHGADSDPVGYQIYNKSGRTLPVSQGKGNPPKQVKVKTVEGSEAGWMNRYALGNMEHADVVWKVEGPADMLALQSVIPKEQLDKHLVLTNSSGSVSLLSDDHLDILAGKVVYVLHDADRDGQVGAQKWCEALSYVCKEVRNVQLPYEIEENHGKDVRDWLNEGGTYDELLAIAKAAPIIKRPTEINESGEEVDKPKDPYAQDRLICAQLKLDILGELPDRKIKVFSEEYGKVVTIDNVNRLSRVDLFQICGPVARKHVYEGGADSGSPNQFHISNVREAVAMLGAQRILTDESCGQGVHITPRNQIVFVDRGRAARLKGDSLVLERHPLIDGQLYDFSCQKTFDFESLGKRLKGMSLDRASHAILSLIELLSRWCFKQTDAPVLLAGLVMAMMLQSIWKWRPQIAVTGESSSGKTILMETINTLFGPLGLLTTKPTEAGLRQVVGNRSVAIQIDEFERCRERQKILELIRTGSRGTRIHRGTADHSGRSFGFRHIVLVASIESGLVRQPDKNRFIKLELLPARSWINIPLDDELRELGQDLLAAAAFYAKDALILCEQLKRRKIEGVDPRLVESYSVPAAMLAVCGAYHDATPDQILDGFFKSMSEDNGPTEADQVALLRDILSTKVLVERDLLTAAEVLDRAATFSSGRDALERDGIKKVDGFLFVATKPVQAKLRGTDWDGQSISEILSRLPGAKSGPNVRRRCGSVRHYGTLVPWQVVAEFIDPTDEDRDDEQAEF